MLVQRAFREGAAVENTEKASAMGVLIGKVSLGNYQHDEVWRWGGSTWLRTYRAASMLYFETLC